MIETELSQNEFYLLISPSGDILKTKNKKDFEAVKDWDAYVFADKVKSSDYIHYLVGQTWHKKIVSRLPPSKDFDENWYYDFNELDLNIGSHIKKIAKGGKQKAVDYQKL